MAEAVVGAVVAAGAEAVSLAIVGEAITFQALAFAAGKAFVVSALAGALRGDGGGSPTQSAQALKQSVRSSVAPRRIVYGQARVSGSLCYAGSSGADNGELWLVVPCHHGEFDSVVATYLNDTLIGDAKFTGVAAQTLYTGTAGQAADTDLMAATADWTDDHRLRGIGYSVLHLTYSPTAYPYGIPNPSWVIKGRKLYDPRDASTAWSDNAALAVLDYLIGTVPTADGSRPVGVGASLDEIDLDSFIAAANACDEAVPLDAGGTQARYTCNGVVDMEEDVAEGRAQRMEQLLTACAGTLVYSGGVYSLYVGEATAPSFAITADMLRGPASYRPRPSRGSAFNTVRGTYVDPAAYYEALDFAPQQDAAALAEDGEEIAQDVDLPFTQDAIAAQRIARQMLARHRAGRQTLVLPLNWSGVGIRAWDTGTVALDLIGITTAQTWRCTVWELAEGGGIDVTLQSEDDAAYDWTAADETAVSTPAKPSMADATAVEAVTGLTAGSASYVTPQGAIVGGLAANWDAATSAFVEAWDVQASIAGADDWSITQQTATSAATFLGLAIGSSYDVRVRARHGNGATGAWATVSGVAVTGDTTAPSQCSGISATAGSGQIALAWTNPADADYRRTRLYRHTANNYAAASLIQTVYGLPGQAGAYTDTVASGATRYYWPIAEDDSGNPSTTPTAVSATAL